MDLAEFASKFGISAIVRRHFAYRKPVSGKDVGGDHILSALIYTRMIDDRQLALTADSIMLAVNQGQALNSMGHRVTPRLIITGETQRNVDGGMATAEGIKAAGGLKIPVWKSPGVTYPIYDSFEASCLAFEVSGDRAVHVNLSGKMNLWTESASLFANRIMGAVLAEYSAYAPVLFDLNYEQLVVLYYGLVEQVELENIPTDENAWEPTRGGGIVISRHGDIAMEFLPDLTVVE